MSEPYTGQIDIFGFNFAPRGWALCDGATLQIRQNTALFSLLGTTYGGDGVNTFVLPKLSGTSPCGVGRGAGLSDYSLGAKFGAPAVTLTPAQMPQHMHIAQALEPQRAALRTGAPTAQSGLTTTSNQPLYSDGISNSAMAPESISSAGGSGAHNNMQPFIVMNYSIALIGVFPQRP